jgi:hypothetical protein
MRPRDIALSIATLLTPLACATAGGEVASVGPQTPHLLPPGAVQGPYVQGGTIFLARLDQPVDTYYTPPGKRFTASVTTPLRGSDGRVLVPVGAKVRGTLASVGDQDIPLLRVQLDSIDTVAGTLPLLASVLGAQHYGWMGPPTPGPYASYLYSYGFSDYGTAASSTVTSGPGQPVEGRTLMQPREIDVPTGALMQLQLVEPLVLPGARLAP